MIAETTSPNSVASNGGITAAVLDTLAARFRLSGLSLLSLSPDGTVVYHDTQAGLFFTRYILPTLQYPDPSTRTEPLKLSAKEANVGVWRPTPGVVLAAFPVMEKKQVTSILLLAGKGRDFAITEDVHRVCGKLGLDTTWLEQQAADLPAWDDDSITRQARLLSGMLSDQTRVRGLEQELDSLSGQLANTYEELSLIYQISGGMRVNRRATEFFKQACLDVQAVMGVRGMGVSLRSSETLRQEPVLYGEVSLPPGGIHRLADELVSRLKQRKTPLLINNLAADKELGWLSEFARQILAVPLQRQEQVLGCMFAIDKGNGEFDSVDSKLLNSIGNESAIYLENAFLFEDVHGLMMGLLHSLTAAVDAKDTYTCGHSERVALVSRELAKTAGLSESEVDRIYMSGLLHDVGKIGVPEAVLQKAGRLTAEEFDLIKKHPEIGSKILADVKQVKDIIPGVLYHHERFDGKGYPSGLAGEAIPLMGRIICLADCFDAMTSSRTYRKALPLEVALNEIRRCAGTQFDPTLAEKFLTINMDRFRAILAEHHESSRTLIGAREIVPAAA